MAVIEPNVTNVSSATSDYAIIVIDMITDFEYEHGNILFNNSIPISRNISNLTKAAKQTGVPVIYISDIIYECNPDLESYIACIKSSSANGSTILDILDPKPEDNFILKPHRSAFYATSLGGLLISLGITNLIFTGITTDICILFTAHDAYMRGYNVTVLSDCVTAVDTAYHNDALAFMERVIEADIRTSQELSFVNTQQLSKTGGDSGIFDKPEPGIDAANA